MEFLNQSPELAATALVGAVSLMLILGCALLKRSSGSWAWLLVTIGVFAAVIWTPTLWRSYTFMIAAGALGVVGGSGIPGKLTAGCAMAAIIGGIEHFVPGGTAAITLLVLSVVGYYQSRSALSHLVRLKRVAELVPGTKPVREVELTGTVIGPDVSIPETEYKAAAWKLGPLGTDYLVIKTEHGPAYAEVATARMSGDSKYLNGEIRKKIFAAERAKPEPRMKEDPTDTNVELFYAGESAYIVGIPAWEMPPTGGGGYRDAEVVPVFRQRSKDTPPVFCANKSETEVRRQSWWTLATWAGWGLVCGGVAVLLAIFGL